MRALLYATIGVLLAWPAAADMYPDASNAKLPQAQTHLGIGETFDAYGAKGDGVTLDNAAIQAALLANVGGTVYGVKGKTYNMRGQVYVPSNTTVDCRGATLQHDPTYGSYVNTILWLGGLVGNPVGLEAAGTNIEVRNCNFVSARPHDVSPNFIMMQPGTNRVSIHNNTFRNTGGGGTTAVLLKQAKLSDIAVYDNYAEDLRYLVYAEGSEVNSTQRCLQVPTAVSCPSTASPPPAGTTTFDVPADAESEIAAGYGYSVMVQNHTDGSNSYRLFGPYDNGTDFTYSGGVITFASALPTAADVSVRFFTWKPEVTPADDWQNLKITGNIGKRFRTAAVQLNCQLHQLARRVPGQDCPRNLVIADNKFDGAYQATGMFNGWPIPGLKSNLILWSQDFTNSVWQPSGLRSPVGGVFSPDYDHRPTAQFLGEDGSTGSHLVKQAVTGTAGTAYTWSCSLQAAGRTSVQTYLQTGSGNGVAAAFDLVAGTVLSQGYQGSGASGLASGMTYQGGGRPGARGGWGWWRVWVTGVMPGSGLQASLYLRNATGISYAGDNTSGINVWGCQVISGATPQPYVPTEGVSAQMISTQLISVNGVDNFTVANNVLGPAADQCIHLEDYASHGTVIGNVCRDVGGIGLFASDTRGVTFAKNRIYDTYQGCLSLAQTTPAPPSSSGDTVSQNQDMTVEDNYCDANNNPNALFGYKIGSGTVVNLRLSGNQTANLPASALAYQFYGPGTINYVGGEPLPRTTVATLPACSAANKYATAAVSDALAPAYNATVVGGGAVAVPVMCDGAVWKAH